MKQPEQSPMRIVYWFALGTFAIGTEGFMIAPLLPNLAQDLSVSLIAAGQLVTVFTLSYAFSSPILTALTGSLGRRHLLIGSIVAFGAANLLAALAFVGVITTRSIIERRISMASGRMASSFSAISSVSTLRR